MASATEKRTRGGSMGIYTSMRMVGFAIGPLIGGFLHDRIGFDAAFYTGAAFIFLGLVLVHFWVHETPDGGRARAAGAFRILDRELLTAGIIGLAIATFLMASSFSMMSALESQINQRLGQGAFGFGLAFSALMVSRLVVQVPLGWLSDRIGRRPLIIGGLILMAPATILLGLAATTLQLVGFRVLQGAASAAIAAPAFALAADLSRSGGEGRQLSIVTTGFGLGIALGPLIAGGLGALIFELPFIIGGALTIVGAWIVYRYVPETVHLRESGAARVQQEALLAEHD
jgi:MFS family permease